MTYRTRVCECHDAGSCKTCKMREYARAYYRRDPERQAVRSAVWVAQNPEKHRARVYAWRAANPAKTEAAKLRNRPQARAHARHIRSKHSPEYFKASLSAQGGLCAICKDAFKSSKDQAADHCHRTGRARGVLCTGCNVFLGRVESALHARILAYRDEWAALHAAEEMSEC